MITPIRATSRALVMALAATVACACLASGAVPVPLATDAAASRRMLEAARAPAVCALSDLARGESGTLFAGESEVALPPGRYRLHAPIAARPLGTLATGTVRLTLQAGETQRELSMVALPRDDEFTDLTLDFAVDTLRRYPVRIGWRVVETEKTRGLIGRRALEMHAPSVDGAAAVAEAGLTDGLDLDIGDLLYEDGAELPFAEACETPHRLMAAGVHIERLSPVAAKVRTDRIVYTPGQPAHAELTLRNDGGQPVQAAFTVFLQSGLSEPVQLTDGVVSLAPRQEVSRRFENLFDTDALRWGAELVVHVDTGDGTTAVGRNVFGVSSNLWETAIIAGHPTFMAAFDDPDRAQTAARELREQGFTGFEAYFWAPCDMLDFNPRDELFFSGQTAYPGTRTGTRNFIEACHGEGLAATFYANLWGGNARPAMEVMRRHPDWFGDANYCTAVLDDWDLLGTPLLGMKTGKLRAPGITTWCYNQLNLKHPEAVFELHAREIIASQAMFGWDAIRYDSYYSRYWNVLAMRLIREMVEREAPGFQFGYNSFAVADWKAGALDDMVGGGGMIMAEGIRIESFQNLNTFAQYVSGWRDIIWPYGGHGPGMIFRTHTDTEEITQLGVEYQASIILAGGGHLYYNPVPGQLGRYMDFALRYSEFLYDNRMRPLRHPEQVVSLDADVKLLEWRQLARTLELGDGKHRLILHFIPEPIDPNPFKDKAMTAPAPLRGLPVTVTLPADATVSGAWWLTAAPEAGHAALAATAEGNTVRFKLPDTRIWSMAVLEYEATQGLPRAVTLKDRSDTYIQDWQIVGPFANDKNSGVQTAYPPEEKVDLSASYAGAEGRTLKWRRTTQPGQPALGHRPLDFRTALDGDTPAAGCAYAYTELIADADVELVLRGKAVDQLALWLNGAAVPFTGGVGLDFVDIDEGQATLALKRGRNTLLAKVCATAMAGWTLAGWNPADEAQPAPYHETGLNWLLALRVADADGNPVEHGVTISAGGAQ